ncbi:MAG TPA: hypothetical protein VEA80_07025 [Vitreimonas sp.]|nr:hypothetical protein [Vitreimonas sp.]HYD87208.1 hypothetical protein [Vitreimonas sp.]
MTHAYGNAALTWLTKIRHSGRAQRDPEPRGNRRIVGPWLPGSSLREAPE